MNGIRRRRYGINALALDGIKPKKYTLKRDAMRFAITYTANAVITYQAFGLDKKRRFC